MSEGYSNRGFDNSGCFLIALVLAPIFVAITVISSFISLLQRSWFKQFSKNVFVYIIEFDNKYKGYSIRDRLALWVKIKGMYKVDYYIAHLSHEIYKSYGIKGHNGRKQIRRSLKSYAIRVHNKSNNG